ncbi:type I secretion protein [Mesorhizobium mediterraneum]|uniref:type I secretion protein n=1 Tax=Mesorhizobium mediterraneum TaxID=43617 RepID=UPI0017840CDC|nr:type I secretion protein [Mesorhizobium mediterraneum]
MDKITEAISHFVGLFEITLEQTRLRKAYDEFKALQAVEEERPELSSHTIDVEAGYNLEDFVPSIQYSPVPPKFVLTTPWSEFQFAPPDIPAIPQPDVVYPGLLLHPEAPLMGSAPSRLILPHIEPPGSVAVLINQELRLSDNDYVGAGGHGLKFSPEAANYGAEMAALLGAAADLSPIDDLEMPGSSEEIVTIIKTAGERLNGHPEESDGEADVFVVKADVIEGTYVNGQSVDEAPKLDDHLPEKHRRADEEEDEEGEPEQPSYTPGSGGIDIDVSVELEAGGNLLVNSVSMANNWLQSPVCAVMGDHVELNAIVQINVSCDSDLVSSSINGWGLNATDPTQGFNIAMFKRVDPSAEAAASKAKQGDFPEHWVVTEVEGDLLIMNWIQQYTLMTDNDVSILSSSGVETLVTAGANTAANDISLDELGFHYDLIVVGGNIYDANIIHQLNVLLDNDLIGAVDGFQTTGEGAASTSGNLLWNQANIVNYGAADRFEAMSEAYRKACESLQNGNGDLSDILDDGPFAGIGALRVLYISGDILNLQYVKQTTILGDSDQVALAMNALAHPEADWTISTGTNSLVNYAYIADVDSTGKTYVGGGIYSDEILIQAELISTGPDLGGQDPDMLVNEAVAFLDDDMLAPEGSQNVAYPSLVPESTYSDPMQSVLA